MPAQRTVCISDAQTLRQNSNPFRPLTIAVMAATLIITFPHFAFASEQVIYAFRGGNDGYEPDGMVQDSSGNLFGTTFFGGSFGEGTIFELSPPAKNGGPWRKKILFTFSVDELGSPAGVILDAAGNLYGTTWFGGTSANGSVFELSPPKHSGGTWIFKTLYSFSTPPDGSQPETPPTMDANGNLYGTTVSGGSGNCGCGTVFQLSPQPDGTWTETTLYNFPGPNGYSAGSLSGVTLDANGVLYGTTFITQPASNAGTVFQLKKNKKGEWQHRVLYAFDKTGVNGAWPVGNVLVDKNGILYGVTQAGAIGSCYGGGCGTVYQLTPTEKGPWTLTTLHEFAGGTDAGYPGSGPIFDASGNIVGTTLAGGDPDCDAPDGCGTVYRLSPSGSTWSETILHIFVGGSDGNGPGTLLLGAGNILYGLAAEGAHGAGIVFDVTP